MNKVSLGDLEYIDDVLKRHEEAMKYLAQSFGFTLEAEKRINEILKPEDEKPEPNKKCEEMFSPEEQQKIKEFERKIDIELSFGNLIENYDIYGS